MGNIDPHQLYPLRCTLADRLLTGTHFTMVLPVVRCSQDTHTLRPMHTHPSSRGHHMAIHQMDHFFLVDKHRDPCRIVKAIGGSPSGIIPGTYHLDHLHLREEAAAGLIIVISGEVGMEVGDDPVAGVVGSITASNLASNRR
jgi:hypothetical protein